MAIADVVTYGFGSYSSVNKIPTHGFSIKQVTLATGRVSVAFSTRAPGVAMSTKAPGIAITTKSPSVGFEVS